LRQRCFSNKYVLLNLYFADKGLRKLTYGVGSGVSVGTGVEVEGGAVVEVGTGVFVEGTDVGLLTVKETIRVDPNWLPFWSASRQ
jgi:hypothetical protein